MSMALILQTAGVTPTEIVGFNLKRLMSQSRVTIRDLARYMGVSYTRVRAVRNGTLVSTLVRLDYIEAVSQLGALRRV